jgi:hypothetical protein
MRLIRVALTGWPLVSAGSLMLVTLPAQAQGPPRFREAVYQQGELKRMRGLPVLTVQGTPEEIGRQAAALTFRETRPLLAVPVAMGLASGRFGGQDGVFRRMLQRCPADHRRELDSFASQARLFSIQRNLLVRLNMLFDTYGALGCSSLIVESSRSTANAPLFGRNLDIPHHGVLEGYSLVVVYRPKGKHAFASIGFPGLFGVFSGMNDQGLALAVHGVFASPDGSPTFNPEGVPSGFVFRRILEDCATVSEAEQILRRTEHVTAQNVVLCDRRGGAVAEVTPRTVAVRKAAGGLCACTNHFRAIGRGGLYCPRYQGLLGGTRMAKLDVPDVARKLHEVNQGSMTLQTMVFEPLPLRLHLSIGPCPSSAHNLQSLDLSSLLDDSNVHVITSSSGNSGRSRRKIRAKD